MFLPPTFGVKFIVTPYECIVGDTIYKFSFKIFIGSLVLVSPALVINI